MVRMSTVTGLLRRDAVWYGDYLQDALAFNEDRQLSWVNRRSRLLRQELHAERAGMTPSGEPYFMFHDRETRRSHYFNSLRRSYLYQGGLRERGRSLASSYAIPQISFASGDLVIDCGANYADLKVYFDEDLRGIDVEYVGIEPGVDEFFCMTRNCTKGTYQLFDCALGTEDSTATFYYSPDGANSSLERPVDVTGEYEVEVRSLDSLLNEAPYRDRRVRLLKLEAEGTEFEILSGAERSLSRIDYIAADMGFERGLEEGSPAPSIIHLLIEKGWTIEAIGDPCSLRFLFANPRAGAGEPS